MKPSYESRQNVTPVAPSNVSTELNHHLSVVAGYDSAMLENLEIIWPAGAQGQ
ncbi:hypothetical protein [Aeromonas sp.]|uniref:hypothetical protein n=1 Tax=Aeromonas sp. TaxID=647 RepID=UPI00257C7E8F|nr:hypothetical protein [Aeromonas sp.]